MRRPLAFALVLMLLLAACGDDDGAENGELVEGLTEQILESPDSAGDVPLSEEEASCFAGDLIDQFGTERMAEALTMNFDEFMAGANEEERLAVIDSMFSCVDFGEVLAAQFGGAVSAESAQCLGEAFISSDLFRSAMADSFGDSTAEPFDDPELMAEMLPLMLECISAEELIDLGETGG